jgi:hypothetical protein
MLSLWQVLDAVAELQAASLELVCWELSVPTEEGRAAFEQARADGLIVATGLDDSTREVLYALTAAGRRALGRRLAR